MHLRQLRACSGAAAVASACVPDGIVRLLDPFLTLGVIHDAATQATAVDDWSRPQRSRGRARRRFSSVWAALWERRPCMQPTRMGHERRLMPNR